MEPGEMKYGVPNIVYDIIQTVGNLLQGVEKMMEYAGMPRRRATRTRRPSFARWPKATVSPRRRSSNG